MTSTALAAPGLEPGAVELRLLELGQGVAAFGELGEDRQGDLRPVGPAQVPQPPVWVVGMGRGDAVPQLPHGVQPGIGRFGFLGRGPGLWSGRWSSLALGAGAGLFC